MSALRDKPSGEALAALAAELGEPEALAARCQAIAAREVAGEAGFAELRAALNARYRPRNERLGDDGPGGDRALLAALAAEIRDGALDHQSPARGALAALLWALTEQKLRESNPDYLTAPLTSP